MEAQEQDDCVVSGTLMGMLRVSRWFGLAPLSFDRLRNGGYRVRVSMPIFITGCSVFILWRIFLLGMFIYDIRKGRIIMQHIIDTTMSYLLLNIVVVFIIILNTWSVFGGMKRIRRLLYILRQIQEINIQLAYDNSVELKVWKFWTLVIAFSCGNNLFLLFYVTLNSLSVNTYTIISFTEFCSVSCLVMQQVVLPLVIKSSVKALNYRIKQLYHTELNDVENQVKQIFSVTKNYRRTNVDTRVPKIVTFTEIDFLINEGDQTNTSQLAKENLENLAQSYLSISTIMTHMVDLEGGRQFLLICIHISCLIFTVYNISSALAATSGLNIPFILLQCMWLSFNSMKVIVIIEPSHRLLREMEKTKVFLSVLMYKLSISDPERRELGSFFQQFLLNQPSCTPLGIYTCNRQLIATIIGGVVSFLVIVMQFDLNSSK